MRETFLEKIQRQKAELRKLRETFGEDQARFAVVSKIKRWKLTVDEYCALWRSQGSVCAICRSDKPQRGDGKWWLQVDHDHACCVGFTDDGRKRGVCGKCTRGLLCISCNFTLGRNIPRTKEESEYLDRYARRGLNSTNANSAGTDDDKSFVSNAGTNVLLTNIYT